ncbi:MAG: N-acetylmuramoyl-L-alanine amidase [Pseudomonadota bacterium]
MIKTQRACCVSGMTIGLFCFSALILMMSPLFGAIGMATPVLAATPAPSAPVQQRTRFIIGLPDKADYQVFALSKPNRVVVEMNTVSFRLPRLPTDGPVGLVKTFKGGSAGNGKSRVIISVTAPVVVDSSNLVASPSGDGHQLVLEFRPMQQTFAGREKLEQKFDKPSGLLGDNDGSTFGSTIASSITNAIGSLLAQPPLPKPAESPSTIAARSYRPIVVIDPGHGGRDSGAKKNGVVEKVVVLEFAKVLRDRLEATGRYKVLMTRDTDKFISLDGRRRFAEKMGAELFIAVHADYAKSNASGATVYSLRQKVAKRLMRKAKHKASTDFRGDRFKANSKADKGAVKAILGDLFDREIKRTNMRTDVVSRSLVKFMGGATNLRKHPHKEAAFKVLKTAHFPSVLVELAYVTNKSDARQLKSASWRGKVAEAMVEAVDRYFNTQIARLPL